MNLAAPVRGTRSCFDPDGSNEARGQGFAWLESLWATIAERNATRPEGSYTAKLLAGGVDTVGRKVTCMNIEGHGFTIGDGKYKSF